MAAPPTNTGASLVDHISLPANASPRGFGVVPRALELRGFKDPSAPAKGKRILLFIVDQNAHAKAGGEGEAADMWSVVLPGAIARATNHEHEPHAADSAASPTSAAVGTTDGAAGTAAAPEDCEAGRTRQATLLLLGRSVQQTIAEDEVRMHSTSALEPHAVCLVTLLRC